MKQQIVEFWSRLRAAAKILWRGIAALESLSPEERAAPWKTREDVIRLVATLKEVADTGGRELALDESAIVIASELYRDLTLDIQAAGHLISAFEASKTPG